MNSRWLLPLGSLLLCQTALAEDVQLNTALVTKVPSSSRSVIRVDPVEKFIDNGGWNTFVETPTLAAPDWQRITADAKGNFQGDAFDGGYALCSYDSTDDRWVYLEEKGASAVYVNGELRAGDPYAFGYASLPLHLRRGTNYFLFTVSRGHLDAHLTDAPNPITVDTRDSTLPDVPYVAPPKHGHINDPELIGAVVVRNASAQPKSVVLQTRLQKGGPWGVSNAVVVPAATVRKVPVIFKGGPGVYEISAKGEAGTPGTVELTRAKKDEAYKVTFESDIDHSIQYYAVWPSTTPGKNQALVLSLHGASVEAIGQARAYSPKDWLTLVCPTNRRPYGFDWEETGRADAMEVLQQAEKVYQPDPRREYLTGHSMGGHGTWSVGSLFPGKFAAIMPSAGWISFSTYGGGGKFDATDPVQAMIARAATAYDTLARKQNLFEPSVYVLHGDADDNVPIAEAKHMVDELQGHSHLQFHWEPGAGHWWDKNPAPGADCVDWAPGFEMFGNTTKQPDTLRVSFATPSPSISNKCDWVTLGNQIQPLVLTTIEALDDSVSGSLVITTHNVGSFECNRIGKASAIIDGQTVKLRTRGPYTFVRDGNVWAQSRGSLAPLVQHGVKSVLLRHPIMVIPTQGGAEDTNLAMTVARYWAESYWYRGNGAIDIVTDQDAMRMGRALNERGVILMGRPSTNLLWARWLDEIGVDVQEGRLGVGTHQAAGNNLALLGLVNRKNGGLVLAAGWTGVAGARLLERSPLFLSGAAYPDLLVWSTESLTNGADGFIGAGFLTPGQPPLDIAWRD